MSDTTQNPGNRPPADLRDQIREANERADAIAAEKDAALAAKDRELAFARAGIDLDSPAGGIFARGYDGDMDVASIKEAAAALNLGPVAAPPADPNADPATTPDTPLAPGEAELLAAQSTLSGSHPDEAPPPADPYAVAAGVVEKAADEGLPQFDALGLGINSLVNSANAGDKRVIVPPRHAQAVG
jgi:hypothetical protein